MNAYRKPGMMGRAVLYTFIPLAPSLKPLQGNILFLKIMNSILHVFFLKEHLLKTKCLLVFREILGRSITFPGEFFFFFKLYIVA